MRQWLNSGVVAVFLLTSVSTAVAATSETYRQLNLFGDIFERVRADYVESVDEAELIENAINGMLQSLDPHSSYLNPKTFRAMQVQTRGEFGGLGIEVTMENGVIKVVSPIDDTPAARAGLRSGDYITHLDGAAILGLTLSQAVEKMRGPITSTITLTVSRPGAEKSFDVSITRDVIQVKSVRGRIEGNALYLRITSFSEKTESGLKRMVEKLSAEAGDYMGVILDLRNNPGGLLDQAIAVSDAFLEQGEIVSTRGRNEEDTRRHNANPGDLVNGKPIIVLMNGGSASASEIVAGALQDHRRAIILGTKSFGKGSVQTIIPLQGQGAIRLTTARYYTPSGRSIQATGIEPDVVVEQSVVTKVDNGRRRRSEADLRGHLESQSNGEDKPKADKPKADKTKAEKPKDYQLTYALDLLKGIALLNGWSRK